MLPDDTPAEFQAYEIIANPKIPGKKEYDFDSISPVPVIRKTALKREYIERQGVILIQDNGVDFAFTKQDMVICPHEWEDLEELEDVAHVQEFVEEKLPEALLALPYKTVFFFGQYPVPFQSGYLFEFYPEANSLFSFDELLTFHDFRQVGPHLRPRGVRILPKLEPADDPMAGGHLA